MTRWILAWIVSPAYRELVAQLRTEVAARKAAEADATYNQQLVGRWQRFADGAASDRERALQEVHELRIGVADLNTLLGRANGDYADLAADLVGLADLERQRNGLLHEIEQLRGTNGCRCATPSVHSTAVLRATVRTQEEMLAHYEGRPHSGTSVCAGNCVRVPA